VDRRFDLRVEDHADPVRELRRLVKVARVYRKLNVGDDLVTAGDIEGATRAYLAAMSMLPDQATNGEAPFWVGVTLAQNGREGEAAYYLRRAYAVEPRWATVLLRLPAAGLLGSVELAERLRKGMST
jgi:tetratricopeptide (TPR) repeat protein